MLEEAQRLKALANEARERAKTMPDPSEAQRLLEAATAQEWEANRIERSYLRLHLLGRKDLR